MPRLADHNARRRLIADSLIRRSARHGLDRVSMKDVAESAQVSVATVQHYFASKADLLRFSFWRVNELAAHRVAQARAAARGQDLATAIHMIIWATLPVSRSTADLYRVSTQFLALGLTAPELLTEGIGGPSAGLEQEIAALMPGTDEEPAAVSAAIIVAASAGLGSALLAGARTPAEVDELLRALIRGVCQTPRVFV